MTETENDLMEIGELYHKTNKEIDFDKKVLEGRNKLREILFNILCKTNINDSTKIL